MAILYIIPRYRLKINHCGYKKGNILHYDLNKNDYRNDCLKYFRFKPKVGFHIDYILFYPEIFEKR